MKKKVFLILGLFVGVAFAQKIDKVKLNQYFYNLEDKHQLMGDFSIHVNGEMLYNMPIGFSNPSNRVELNKDTKFRIGSISKTFTATLILKAQEEGVLSIDDALVKYYPQVANSEKITIKNLLNHTSGLADFTKKTVERSFYYTEQTKENLLAQIIKIGLVKENAQKYHYSNINYALLTFILEDVYAKPYKDILKEKITLPLGLENTFFGTKIDLSKNEAHSFKYFENWLKQPETSSSVALGAGAIVSNTTDLTTFINTLFNGKIVTKQSLELMKPAKSQYGLGMFSVPFNQFLGYGHNGSIDGFSSYLVLIPEQNITICALFNFKDKKTNINDIILNLYRAAMGKPIVKSSKKGLIEKIENPEKYAGLYTNETFPLQITISAKDQQVYAQATGQGKFKLDAYPNHMFKFDEAGIQMKFLLDEKVLLFQQGTNRFEFKKQEQQPVKATPAKRKKKKRSRR